MLPSWIQDLNKDCLVEKKKIVNVFSSLYLEYATVWDNIWILLVYIF